MELFEIKDDQVTFSPQALTLKPFRALWDRDTTEGKQVAVAELAAVYFFIDYKSDFSEIMDLQEQLTHIKSVVVGMSKDWEPDDVFRGACRFYQDRQETHATLLLQDSRHALNSVREFLRDIDLKERDEKGKYVHDVKKITDTLSGIHKITESIFETEQQVKKQIQQKTETARGGKEKAIFEDGI